MSKPHITVISDHPLKLVITKNGRAVNESTAKVQLKKHYPNKTFIIQTGDHSTICTETHITT